MARSTANPDIDVPKDMMQFRVLKTTIRDSVGQYCEPGDLGCFTKEDAQTYLDQEMIRVELPDDFGGGDGASGHSDEGGTTQEHSEPDGANQSDDSEQSQAEAASGTTAEASGDGDTSTAPRGRAAGRTGSKKAPKSS